MIFQAIAALAYIVLQGRRALLVLLHQMLHHLLCTQRRRAGSPCGHAAGAHASVASTIMEVPGNFGSGSVPPQPTSVSVSPASRLYASDGPLQWFPTKGKRSWSGADECVSHIKSAPPGCKMASASLLCRLRMAPFARNAEMGFPSREPWFGCSKRTTARQNVCASTEDAVDHGVGIIRSPGGPGVRGTAGRHIQTPKLGVDCVVKRKVRRRGRIPTMLQRPWPGPPAPWRGVPYRPGRLAGRPRQTPQLSGSASHALASLAKEVIPPLLAPTSGRPEAMASSGCDAEWFARVGMHEQVTTGVDFGQPLAVSDVVKKVNLAGRVLHGQPLQALAFDAIAHQDQPVIARYGRCPATASSRSAGADSSPAPGGRHRAAEWCRGAHWIAAADAGASPGVRRAGENRATSTPMGRIQIPRANPVPSRSGHQLSRGMLRDRHVMVKEGEVDPVHVPAAEAAMECAVARVGSHVLVHALAAQPQHHRTKVQIVQQVFADHAAQVVQVVLVADFDDVRPFFAQDPAYGVLGIQVLRRVDDNGNCHRSGPWARARM